MTSPHTLSGKRNKLLMMAPLSECPKKTKFLEEVMKCLSSERRNDSEMCSSEKCLSTRNAKYSAVERKKMKSKKEAEADMRLRFYYPRLGLMTMPDET